MTDQELIDIVENRQKDVVIVGAGDAGKYLYRVLRMDCPGKGILICDNARKKQGKADGYEVVSVEKAASSFPQALYLLTSRIHEGTMRVQLRNLGIAEADIYPGMTDGVQEYLEEKREGVKFQPLEKLQFEVDITAHCNLNCRCCSQFSCIADEEYLALESMEQDFNRLGELFHGEAGRIYLIGGEPLLHPQLNECMDIARKYFPIGTISIFTNGLLLLKQDEGFWSKCREREISIIVTKYPIPLDHSKIVEKAKEEQVGFEFFGTSEDFKYMTNLGLDLEGKQDVLRSFVHCVESNNCVKLRGGKLYTCTRPAAIYKFNQFFGKSLEVSDKDYIDIYQAKDHTEILEKLASPIPFCRYCNVLGERKAMRWGQTDRRIDEWM